MNDIAMKYISKIVSSPSGVYILHSLDNALLSMAADSIVQSLLCEHRNACGVCESCKRYALHKHADHIHIDMPIINVETVQSIIASSYISPLFGEYKVIQIDNVDVMSEIAQNKILKTLEEHNSSTIFLLTTTHISRILPTILSRAQKINVDNWAENNADGIYTSNANISDIRSQSDDDVISMSKYAESLIMGIENGDDISSFVYDGKTDKNQREILLQTLLNMYNDYMYISIGKQEYCTYKALAPITMDTMQIMGIIELLQIVYDMNNSNVSMMYIIDYFVSKAYKIKGKI